MTIRTAKFFIGQIVRHRVYPFRGVIFDVGFVDLVDEDDVGVGQGGGGAGLAEEALAELGVPRHVGVEDLEGDGSTQLGILSPVDGGKAARADGL